MAKKMDRTDFLNKILNIYGRAFGQTKEGIAAKESWLASCFEVLPSTNCNYERLWLHFLQNFDCRTILEIPSAQWLYKASTNYIIQAPRDEALVLLDNMPKGDPPPPEWYKMRQKFSNWTNTEELYV